VLLAPGNGEGRGAAGLDRDPPLDAGPSGRPAFGVALAVGGTALLAVGARSWPQAWTPWRCTSVLTIAWLLLVGARMIRRRAA